MNSTQLISCNKEIAVAIAPYEQASTELVIVTTVFCVLKVKQAIRLRKLTFNKLDWLVQRLAGAEQDTNTSRWYLPISGEDLKQIRAKYWKGTDDKNDTKVKHSNGNVTFSGSKALPRNKNNDFSIETKDHTTDHNSEIFEVLLKEVQELRREVNDMKKSK